MPEDEFEERARKRNGAVEYAKGQGYSVEVDSSGAGRSLMWRFNDRDRALLVLLGKELTNHRGIRIPLPVPLPTRKPTPGDLEQKLLIVSTIHHRLEQVLVMVGQMEMTPERITSIIASELMGDSAVSVRLCPGYGDDHIWAWTQDMGRLKLQFEERCSSHPERRVIERRKGT